ncbi:MULTISPECIES: hypothetical protein [unclassified Lysobacter]|uniref:hypothetical protein n=1 Tax=unclassified Lysobacter TaxID=2635362 RepID=UPI000700B8B1|nr:MULTISPECIES: hypothetical protein [unclassified Lysobacter]KRA21266.1 hypothetical protein ASD69_08355 [Lysobacter sp. Root604]KRD30482.1 hypothetical protein ASE35_17335 [Lysobacter sp. Root916]KRD80295.1 hypothetical protein ASE43_05365 [Lysobacter sp. Root983]
MDYLFPILFLGVVAYFIFRYVRSGSLTGALLGGTIKREVGKVELTGGAFTSQTFNVIRMEDSDGQGFVALSVVSKAPLAISMVPFRLTKAQALEVAKLLQQAAL